MPESYRVALFIHLCALIAAAVAAGLAHFASARLPRARSTSEAAQWHAIGGKVGPIFPLAIITFFATGGYMVHASGMWSWSAGWIVDGIIGAASLLVLGGYTSARHKAFAKRLQEHARIHAGEAPAIRPDAVADTTAWMSTGLALGVACVMTIKPGMGGGLAVLAAGLAAGALVASLERRAHSAAPASGTSAAAGPAWRISP